MMDTPLRHSNPLRPPVDLEIGECPAGLPRDADPHGRTVCVSVKEGFDDVGGCCEARLGQRRAAAGDHVAGADRLHGHLEGAGRGAAHRPASERGRRRPGRSAGSRRRAPGRVRVPARLVPVLAGPDAPRRLHLRPVRRELHGRGARRRRGLHRRPVSHRLGARSRSPSRGSRATGSGSGWTSRAWLRSSSRTAVPASTSACSKRATSRPATTS